MIYIAADHKGFAAKNQIKSFLETAGYQVRDLGADTFDEQDDYPDFAFKLGETVAEAEENRGILLCGSGIGVAIAANKVKDIRAAYLESKEHAIKSREDDDANVMVLDAMTFNATKDFEIIEAWLNTPFSGAERHLRRINKIKSYESQ